MPRTRVQGVELYYEVTGDGDPLVLVHGSWSDHHNWQGVVPGLASAFRVVTYDRRGHSESERPLGQGSRREDEDDLAALMETLDVAPAHVAGNSFGASITLGLAARRPELFRTVIAHEPPLLAIVADDPEVRPVMDQFRAKIDAVLDQLRAGDIPGGTRRFVEEVALGPGGWEQLPERARETFMRNAPTWLDENRDPDWATLDLARLSELTAPALLTEGDQSPPWFPKIITKLAGAIPHARRKTYVGAGHIPQVTHPDAHVETVTEFIGAGARATVE